MSIIIEVRDCETDEVVHTVNGGTFPDKVERGMNINLSDRFYTVQVEAE